MPRINRAEGRSSPPVVCLVALWTGNLPGIELDLTAVETNIVSFRITTVPAAEIVQKLKDVGVLVLANAVDKIRAVTHLGVSREDIGEAVGIISEIME